MRWRWCAPDAVRLWKTPLVPTLCDDWQDDPGLTPAESAAIGELQRLATAERCSVLLYETFTANHIHRHRTPFLRAMVAEAHRCGVLLVMDDTMCSVRCGRFFSYRPAPVSHPRGCCMHYHGADTKPDLVIVGKPWLLSLLIQLDCPDGCATWQSIGPRAVFGA